MTSDTAQGYAVYDNSKWTELKLTTYPLKVQGPKDVDIAIDFCGVCGTDHHTVSGGWGKTKGEFCVTGHEIIGIVTAIGPEVTLCKVGDRVGVGAHAFECNECERCKAGASNYCTNSVSTYNSVYPDQTISKGGYASNIRVNEWCAYPIPEGISSEEASPLMCAGLTVFAPLKQQGCGPGKKVGVLGIGGLGHLGLQFAKALGAEVYAFSHSDSKREEAAKLGADHFIATKNEGFQIPLKGTLDMVLITASSSSLPLNEILTTLKVRGSVVFVGLPEDAWPELKTFAFLGNGSFIGASLLGSRQEALEMLQVAVEHNVRPWITVRPMKEAGQALRDLADGKPRYRYVLKQDIVDHKH